MTSSRPSENALGSSADTRVRAGSGVLLLGVLIVGANLRVAITPVGPVIGDIRDSLHLAASTASILTSLPLLAFALVSPLAPLVSRRFGIPRALGLALALLVVALVVRSLPAPTPNGGGTAFVSGATLWGGTALMGVAIAVLNVVLPSLVKLEFPQRVGSVTGLYSAVQSSFAAIAAGIAVPLAAWGGWRVALGVWAALAVVAIGVLAPQFRRPRSVGAPTTSDPATSVPTTRDPATSDPASPVERPARGASPWRRPLGWQVTIFMGMQSTVYYVLITWLPSVEKVSGVGAAQAGFHQLLLNGFAIAGSLTASAVIPRMRDQRPLALAATLLVALGITTTLALPAAAAVGVSITGVGTGGAIVLALSLFGLRTRHPLDAARLSGMAQSVGYLVAAAGPIAIGVLHDATGSWGVAIGALFPLLAVQLVAGLLAGRARTL